MHELESKYLSLKSEFARVANARETLVDEKKAARTVQELQMTGGLEQNSWLT